MFDEFHVTWQLASSPLILRVRDTVRALRASGYVLVVEDDDDTRTQMADILTAAGFDVVSVADGTDALPHLESSEPPALVLLDLTMPKMDGATFLRRKIKKSPTPIAVIIVTADQNAALARLLPSLPKPVDPEKLIAMVNAFVPRRRA